MDGHGRKIKARGERKTRVEQFSLTLNEALQLSLNADSLPVIMVN